MKVYRVYFTVLICVLPLILVTVASADDPPKSASYSLTPTPVSLPLKGRSDPVPIQETTDVLDLATANITQMEIPELSGSSAPATLALPRTDLFPTFSQPSKGNFVPGSILPVEVSDGEFKIISESHSGQVTVSGLEVETASSTQIMFEDFESGFTEGGGWTRSSSTSLYWDDVDCFPVESSGARSIWAADDFIGDTPCNEQYGNNMNSWLLYGPFSLTDANSASLDFYYRLESESGYDFFRWLASTDGNSFYGYSVSGTYTSGPFNNGYNFVSFDLSNVPVLGDLTGRSQVWVAFRFLSDTTITDRGPFVDQVSLRKNSDTRLYLTNENFDVIEFPNTRWESADYGGTGHFWDDVSISQGPNCPPKSYNWSLWPADEGPNGLDSCQGDMYANNMYSWMMYGPFSLTGASEAWIDFYFRIVSETGYDFLFWGVSTNNYNYYGRQISGNYTGGPHTNGYNLMRINLTNIPVLGDLRGESQVWLAFIFESDGSVTGQGPFIDDVGVVVERTISDEVLLPVIIKSPPLQTPKTNLSVWNNTSGNLQTYTVENVLLNGVSIGNVNCPVIPPGQTRFCGTFDAGSYNVNLLPAACPNFNGGNKPFPEGDYTAEVRCPR